MSAGVKGAEAELPRQQAIWAGPEALWLTLAPPLVVCACLDDPEWAAALALPPTAADLADAARGLADDRRRRFLQRRAVLRGLAGRMLGCAAAEVVIAHDAQGAPCVTAPAGRLHVSVAERGALAAFGLARGPIGVDMEPVREAMEPAWNVLHASERAWLEGLAAEARHSAFLQIWTVKEAYLKMLGMGLRIEPAGVAVKIGAGGAAAVICAAPGHRKQFPRLAAPPLREEGQGLEARNRRKNSPPPTPAPSPRGGGQSPPLQQPSSKLEARCWAEWRLLPLGGEPVCVALTALKDRRRQGS